MAAPINGLNIQMSHFLVQIPNAHQTMLKTTPTCMSPLMVLATAVFLSEYLVIYLSISMV